MKRIPYAFITLLLLLTSCTNRVNKQDNITNSDETVKNDISEENQSIIPLDKVKTDTPDNIDAKKSEMFYIKGELPDIGDFSGAKQRHYKAYTPYYIPSDSYGKIVPFVGSYKVFSTKNESYPLKMGYASYGLCDGEGRIIMDASEATRNVRYIKTNDGFAFYNLSITDKPENETEDDVYLPQKSLLIPESGEWCIELEKGSMLYDAGNGVIIISVYKAPELPGEIVLYDYNGKELSRLGTYDNVFLSDCGLICVMNWADDNSFKGYINTAGEKVLGPYKQLTAFNSKGIAAIEDQEGWYFIDTSGNKLNDVPYLNISEYKKDYSLDEPAVFLARRKDNDRVSDIYSADGKLVGTISGSTYYHILFPKNGDLIYYYTDHSSSKMIYKRLSDNSDLICKEYGKPANKYGVSDDYFVYEDEENKIGCVFDINGDTVLKIEDFFEIHRITDDGKYIFYSCGGYNTHYDNEKKQSVTELDSTTHIYNTEKGEVVYSLEDSAYPNFAGENKEYIILSMLSDDSSSIFGSPDCYCLFDIENEKMVFENCSSIQYMESGYFVVCTENSCALYDSDLKLILKQYNE